MRSSAYLPIPLLILSALPSVGSALAAEGSGQITVKTEAEAAAKPKRWGFLLGMSGNSSFHESSDPAKQEYLQITTNPSYQISDDWKATYALTHTKDLRGERDLTIYDSALVLGYAGAQLNPYLKLSGSVSAKVPLAKTVREGESMITTFGLTPKFALDLSRTKLSALSLSYSLGLRRAFHRYTTNANGNSNDQYRVTQIVNADVELVDGLSLTSEYSYSSRWTYAGNIFAIFAYSAGLSYQATEALGLDLSVGTTADALKDDGVSSHITVFDKNISEMSLGATYSF